MEINFCDNFVSGDMPYTGGQLILHVKALNASLCQQTIEQFVKLLPGSFKVEDYYGFQYRDGRDCMQYCTLT